VAYSAGTAFLQIVPSFRGFTRTMSDEAGKAGRDAGAAFDREFTAATRNTGKSTRVGPDKAEVAKQGAESGGTFADAFKRRLDAAAKSLPDFNVRLVTTEAERKLHDLQIELEGLRDAQLGIDVDEHEALAHLDDIQARLRRLAAESPSIQLRVDAAKASAELEALQRQVKLLDGQEPTIRPKVETRAATSSLNGLYLLLGALAPAIIPLGAAAIPAFAALTTGAGAAALGIGSVVIALTPTIEAIKLAGKAADGSKADVEKYQQALAGLTPAGRQFVAFVTKELQPTLRGIGDEVQTAFIPGLIRGFRAALPSVSIFREALVQAALGMSELAGRAGQALASPFFQGFFRFIRDTARQDIVTLGVILGNLAKGFLGLVQAFNPVTQSLGRGLELLSAKFAAFGASAAAGTNDTFNRFLGYLRETLPLVKEFFVALGRASGNLIIAFAPLGGVVLQSLTALLNVIAKMPPSLINALAIAFVSLSTAMKFYGVVNALTLAFEGLDVALLANPVGVAIAAVVGLGIALVICYQRFQTFRAIVDGVVAFMRDHVSTTVFLLAGSFGFLAAQVVLHWGAIQNAIVGAWERFIRPSLQAMAAFFTDVVIPAFRTMGAVGAASWRAISDATQAAWGVIRAILGGIGDILNVTVVPVFRVFGQVVAAVWRQMVGDAREWGAALRVVFDGVRVLLSAIGPVFGAFASAAGVAFTAAGRAGQVMWDALRVVLGGIGSFINTTVLPPLRLLGSVAAVEFGILARAAQTAWDVIRPALSLLASLLNVTVVPALRVLATVASSAFGAAAQAVNAFGSIARPILTGIASLLQNNVFPVVRAFASVVVGPTFADAGRFISAFWNNIARPALTAFTTYLGGPLATATRAVGGVIATVFAAAGHVIALWWDAARAVLEGARTYIVGPFAAVWTFISRHISTILTAIKVAAQVWSATLLVIFGGIVAFMQGPLAAGFRALQSVISTVFNAIQAIIAREINAVRAVLSAFMAFMSGPLATGFRVLQSLATSVFTAIQTVISREISIVRTVLTALIAFIQGALSAALRTLQSLVTSVFTTIRNIITAQINAVRAVFQSLIAFLQGPVAAAWNAFRNLVDGVFRFLTNAANVFAGALRRAFTTIRDYLAGPLAAAFNSFRDVATGSLQRVQGVVGQVASAIGSAMGGIRSAVEGTVKFIADQWGRLTGIFKGPVGVLVHDVYGGIKKVWNATASHLPGIDKLPDLGSVPGFARGGVFPGYSPGRDTLLARVSPGEGVLVPEAVRGIASTMGTSPLQAINSINATYSNRVSGSPLKDDRLAFVSGGLVPNPIKKLAGGVKNVGGKVLGGLKDDIGDAIGGVKNWVQGKIADSLGILLKPVRALINRGIPGGDDYAKMVRAVPNNLLDGLLNLVKNKDAEFNASLAVGSYGTAEQQKNASIIIGVGKRLGASHRDLLISLMTALQESNLRNIAFGDRDSLGLFQQRDAWGTREQRLDPAEAARMFFQGGHGGQRGLFAFKNRDQMSLTQAAQAVQVSAFPDAYAKWEDEARQLLDGPGPLPTSGAKGILAGLAFARSQAGKPYVWGKSGPSSYDCSGFMSAIANVVQGRYPYSRRFATPSMEGYPSQVGPFVKGSKGAFSIGVKVGNPGHTAGTINGVNVESRGGRGVLIGTSARGTYNSYFDKYYHLGGYAKGGLIRDLMRRIPGDPPFDVLSPRGLSYNPNAVEALEVAKALKFDSGGYLPPGVSLALNKTGKPEPILTSGQWEDLTSAMRDTRAPAGVGAAPLVHIDDFHATPTQSPRAIAEDLAWIARGRG
jgi:phage-related protein